MRAIATPFIVMAHKNCPIKDLADTLHKINFRGPSEGRHIIDGENYLDPEQLKLLAHLKVSSKKAGFDLDLSKLVADRDYAIGRLDEFASSDSEELILASLMVKDKLGLMPTPAAPVAVVEVKAVDEGAKKDAEKYKFGPRG